MDTLDLIEIGLSALKTERRKSKTEESRMEDVKPAENTEAVQDSPADHGKTHADNNPIPGISETKEENSAPNVAKPAVCNDVESEQNVIKAEHVKLTTDINNNEENGEENSDEEEVFPSLTKEEEEKSHYAHLCRLLLEGSAHALRHVFNLIHPAISLGDRLSKPDALKVLRRLRLQNTLSGKQWDALYPKQRKRISSKNYDTPLLMLLLQNICHMSPPYPNGWRGVPLPGDISIAADVTRVSYFRKLLASKQGVSAADYEAYWSQIGEILVRIGGTPIKVKLDRLARDKMPSQVQNIWINTLTAWDSEAGEYNTSEITTTPESSSQEPGRSSTARTSVRLPRVARSSTVSNDWEDGSLASIVTSGAQLQRAIYSSRARLPTRSKTKGSDMLPRQTLSQEDRSVLLRFYKVLVDNVKSETVVGKLVQAGILTHEEKNSINLAPRNPDRMKALLGVLPRKSTQALNAFCEAIKYRHTSIYDQLCKARQQAQSKPDDVSECCTYLKSSYRNLYSQFSPVSWHPEATTDILDFYVQPHITDFHGRRVEPDQVLSPHVKSNNPRRVLLEGASGTGKSLLCHYLAYGWATGKFTHLQRFKLVFVLDLKRLMGMSLAQGVQEQCMSGTRRSVAEIDNMIKAHQNEVLFLLDGYEDISGHCAEEITGVLHRHSLRHCYALLTSNRGHVSGSLGKNFDTRLVLMGLDTDLQETLVHKYISVTDTPQELYARLLAKAINEYDTTVRIMALNPLLNLCMCLICEMHGALDFNTVSFLMSNFMEAAKKLYCQTNDIKAARDIILSENVEKCFCHLAEQASKNIVRNRSIFDYELPSQDIYSIESVEPIFKFGLLYSVPQTRSMDKWCFTNRAFQEYLAGWHLSKLKEEAFEPYLDTLLNEKQMHNVCMYYCGLLRFNNNHTSLQRVFETLAEVNQELWRVIPARCPSSRRGSSKRSSSAMTTSTFSSGTLSDFSLSLRCISEVEGRKDLIAPLIPSFPPRISMRSREVPDIRAISGLATILLSNAAPTTELDLRLDHFAKYHEYTFLLLADSVEQSQNITSLKLHWTSDELLALFLANVYGNNTSIKTIRCFDGLRQTGAKISATVWSHMRLACDNMKNVELFHFTHCKNSALVTSIVRNVPFSVQDINLTGSTISQVSAQEISNRLEKSQVIHMLNLSNIQLKRADFMYLCQGLRLSLSLKDLDLSATKLDSNCFSQLSEAVKFNRSIVRLDLSHSEMNDDSCKVIGHAMGINKTVLELVLIDCTMSQDGLRFLHKLKRSNILVLGVDNRNYLGNMHYTTGNIRFSLPAIKMTVAQ